jgi:hypothetical protein
LALHDIRLLTVASAKVAGSAPGCKALGLSDRHAERDPPETGNIAVEDRRHAPRDVRCAHAGA